VRFPLEGDEIGSDELRRDGQSRLSRHAETSRELRDVHVVVGKQRDECAVLGVGDAERFETLIHGDLEAVLNASGLDHDVPPAGARDVVDVAHGGRSYREGLTPRRT
jgi:hypothetical protein